MGEKSRARFVIAIALILVVAVCYSFTASVFQDSPSVGFADVGRFPGEEVNEPDPFGDMTLVEVTPDTVQEVITKLERYASYSRTITVEYLNGDAVAGTLTASVMVDGGWTRADVVEQNGRKEHTIVGDGIRWLWYDNERRYIETEASQAAADLIQRIPTYEDVLEVDRARITAASYELRGGLPCVYVEVHEPELDYLERFWVSVESGLLVSSETVREGAVVYRMSSYQVESPLSEAESGFTLPDGTVLHRSAG